jgi:hypothetical protein
VRTSVNGLDIERMAGLVRTTLLPELRLESMHPDEPIVLHHMPEGWTALGAGNYAGVFALKVDGGVEAKAEIVAKVYAPGRPGWEDEVEVYRRLGDHPAYSRCYFAEAAGGYRYLLLKRLRGVTLYRCILQGLQIPDAAIQDIEEALAYARSRGLRPHDVHGKNVMVSEGRGLVVDVSDFLKEEPCAMWDDLKKAYDRVYMPFLSRSPRPIPEWLLEGVRKGYRLFRS